MLISSVLNYKLLFYKKVLMFIILIMGACMSMCTCVQGPQSPEEGSSLYVGTGNQVLWKNYSCFRVALEVFLSPPQVGGTDVSVFLLP